jgi:hypothetical protein
MDSINRRIWAKFRIRRGDTPPYRALRGRREYLAELFGDLEYKEGLELGVQRGLYSEILFQSVPGLHLTCVDPWKAFSRKIDDEVNETYYQECMQRLAPYNATIMRMGSMEAVKLIPDKSLDFLYIDQMHNFDSVMSDMIFWIPKVKSGGIVAGHDYCESYQYGVIDAVKAYTYAHCIWFWYLTREHEATFFWVNW